MHISKSLVVKHTIALVCFIILLSLQPSNAAEASAKNELVFLNWSEYMDPELIARFEKQFDAKVTDVFFESDDARDDMLVATDASGFDIAVVNGITVRNYAKAGWLEPINREEVPNIKYLIPRYQTAFPDTSQYAVPFFFGTVGIAYRSDLVKKPPNDWMDIFRPDESLRGKIAMTNDVRDLFGAALKSLDYSVNSADLDENRQAADLLIQQKPFVKTYNYLTLDEKSALVTGDIVMAIFYNGDALMVAEHHEAIKYLVPDQGGNLWIDYLTVMKNALNKELSWKFINFLNEPVNAAQLAEFLYYATPNSEAEKLLSAELLHNPVVYPGEEILEKSEMDGIIPADVQKMRNSIISGLLQK